MEVKTYGCDQCRYLAGHRCKLWEVKVTDPHNSHCESFRYTWDTEPDLSTWQGIAKAQ